MKALRKLLSSVHRKEETTPPDWLVALDENRLTDEAFAARCRQMRALVAEDGEYLREGIASFLRRHFLRVDAARDGLEALELYKQAAGGYDVVFLDVQMPIMGGTEAARRIRQSGLPGADTLPIIAMTGDAAAELMGAAEFQSFLKKPFSFDAMLRVLRETLEKGAMPTSADTR